MSVGRCLIITWIGKKGCAKTAGLSDTQLYKQGKTRTSRELKHNNVWLDRRIRAIDENKYYITEDGE